MYAVNRLVPLSDGWDVIVVGGGPAGCTAAAAAAREGAKTLLVEATGALGGMGTSGLIPAWCPFSDLEKIIYRGLGEQIFNRLKEGMPHIPKDKLDWVEIEPELLKRIYDDVVVSSGAEILFNTTLSGVDTDDNGKVTGILLSNKNGLTAYQAKVYVDCTGDGDLAAWAGAEYEKGDAETGDMQAATLCFVLTNVDEYAYRYLGNLYGGNPESPIHAILKSGKYPLIKDTHLCHSLIGPGTVGFNAGHIWGVDNTKPESVSAALVEGRKMAEQFKQGLQEFFPAAFGNAHLAVTAPLLGIRETRRIIGDYVLTAEDYLARQSFADEICRNSYYIDIHRTPKEKAHDAATGTKKEFERYGKGESHGIPYRCLTPKGLDNVLVAGRAISCDRVILGSVRVMPTCLATGEAAGLAAALATQAVNVNVHTVDTETLRNRLKEEGQYLP
ncbi:MAG: tat (twin-arginine translocation) pathway signal sequence [Clostridiales bacterium 43-6]|nr:MAG: tat (twin-arginine translocation) pathway signal sequence [Clostridiales bacterium 43-6]